jgi:hypothetical protein
MKSMFMLLIALLPCKVLAGPVVGEENYVNYPALPSADPNGFDWASSSNRPRVEAPTLARSALPSQIQNGDFSSGIGWAVRVGYQDPYPNGTLVVGGPVQLDFFGAALPAGRLLHGDYPSSGSLSQSVHIEPGKRLAYYWKPTISSYGFGLYPQSITHGFINVKITDLLSGTVLANLNGSSINYLQTNTSSDFVSRYSEIDLTKYAGLDVNIEFSVTSTSLGGAYGIAKPSRSAIDNVYIINAPTSVFTGAATAGQWFNPHRAGSGWDLRKAPDGSYYAIWFTYNEAGLPVWFYSSGGQFSNGIFQAQLYQCTRVTATNCNVVGRVKLKLLSSSDGYMQFDFYNIAGSGEWDGLEYFSALLANGGSGSGWFTAANTADSGWGFTTIKYSNYNTPNVANLFMPIYYYDQSGVAQWGIVETNGWTNNSMVNVVRQRGGLCPTCEGTYPVISRQSVGTARVNFDTADQSSVLAEFQMLNPTWVKPLQRFNKLTN